MICNLCPRRCNTDRSKQTGFCGIGDVSYVVRAALHKWEEPFLSGKVGSGTIFFCGCNLRCLFCQNHEISTKGKTDNAVPIDAQVLAQMMIRLQNAGANNINFVTPTPHIYVIRDAIITARQMGLVIPTVFNTNGYVMPTSLEMLDGLIDIYIPDLKYVSDDVAKKISMAENYPKYAKAAIDEMYRQCGQLTFDENGMAKKGVAIRHLVLPAHIDETRNVLDYIAEHFPKSMYVSLMAQYFPAHRAMENPPFDRPLLKREYKRAVDYAIDLGLLNVMIQKLSSGSSEFVPTWGEIV